MTRLILNLFRIGNLRKLEVQGGVKYFSVDTRNIYYFNYNLLACDDM